jgi:hypothetical protein
MRMIFIIAFALLCVAIGATVTAQGGFFALSQACQNVPATASNIPTSIVSALPACNASTNGQIYLVTDALLPSILSVLTGGGAVTLVSHCVSGTGWVAA